VRGTIFATARLAEPKAMLKLPAALQQAMARAPWRDRAGSRRLARARRELCRDGEV
jgi:hypothetical protein